MTPGVTVDLRAAQRPGYRDRGVGRYAMSLTRALVAGHADLIRRVVVDPDLPPAPDMGELRTSPLLTTDAAGDAGGVFHVMAPFDLTVPLAALWPRSIRASGPALVVTVYDLIPEVMADVYLHDPGVRRRYRARRQLVRAADAVVTLSASSADDIIDRLGVAPERVHVVGAACSAAFRPPHDRAAAGDEARRAVPGLGPSWVVYNGAVEPRKNMERLVEAYAALPAPVRERTQLVLVCRLDALQRNHFEVRARQLGIDGQLVLPGFLPDATLGRLYQGAELVVFPSLYEGYGLPVAEALACGAAVVASATSALPELVAPDATFDPHRTDSIRASLELALTDAAHLGRLRAWAGRPQPGWPDVAGRVAAVYREVVARPSLRAPGRVTWRRRPRLAMVTPWPPQRSGVADYSARLVAALVDGGLADVDLFVDGGPLGESAPVTGGGAAGAPGDPDRNLAGAAGGGFPAGSLAMAPGALHRAAPVRGGYDGVVLTIGNSEFHAGALGLLRSGHLHPVVVAHDVRLTGLYRHSTARGAVPEGFAAALGAMYPQLGDVMEDGWVPPSAAERHGILMAREAIARSARFLTTSDYAAALARLDAAPGDGDRIGVLPFAYPPVVARDPGTEEEGLIATFGLVDPVKRPEVLIAALARLGVDRPAAHLAFVGPIATHDRVGLQALADDLGVGSRVAFSGHTDSGAYRRWLGRAAVAVQLRSRSNGESSAAIGDCLTHGVATVVSAVGPQRDLPPSVAKVGPRAGADELAAVIAVLLDDGTARRRAAGAAQEWVSARGFPVAAAQLVEEVRRLGAAAQVGGGLPAARFGVPAGAGRPA